MMTPTTTTSSTTTAAAAAATPTTSPLEVVADAAGAAAETEPMVESSRVCVAQCQDSPAIKAIQEVKDKQSSKDAPAVPEFKAEVVKRNVVIFVLLHSAMFYGMYLALFHAMWKTWLFAYVLGQLAGLGVTAGAHRLWSHKSYKAKLPLRIVLMLFNCLACQNDLYEWTRDHRVHHKYSETDADPHNVNRGFFFAHVGWLMCKKHPEVFLKGKSVDCSDLLQDPVIRFQRACYIPLVAIICFYMPMVMPYYLFGESYLNGFFVAGMTRYVMSLNFTWLVNSAAHIWGNKPYDKNISPVENAFVSLVAIGEGFHNYHHTFPWDYRTSELGWKINLTSIFIEAMAYIGQAYDLKTVPNHVVKKRMLRTGDGTKDCFDSIENRQPHDQHHHAHPEEVPYEEVFPNRD